MKFSHTPAPWSLGSNGASTKVVDADGKAVCMVTYRKDHWNGDLLAAAPDLLAALREIVAAIESGEADGYSPSGDWFREAKAALLKATGEAA